MPKEKGKAKEKSNILSTALRPSSKKESFCNSCKKELVPDEYEKHQEFELFNSKFWDFIKENEENISKNIGFDVKIISNRINSLVPSCGFLNNGNEGEEFFPSFLPKVREASEEVFFLYNNLSNFFDNKLDSKIKEEIKIRDEEIENLRIESENLLQRVRKNERTVQAFKNFFDKVKEKTYSLFSVFSSFDSKVEDLKIISGKLKELIELIIKDKEAIINLNELVIENDLLIKNNKINNDKKIENKKKIENNIKELLFDLSKSLMLANNLNEEVESLSTSIKTIEIIEDKVKSFSLDIKEVKTEIEKVSREEGNSNLISNISLLSRQVSLVDTN